MIGLWAVHGKTEDVTTLKTVLQNTVSEKYVHYEPGCPLLEDDSILGDFGYTASGNSSSAAQQDLWL